jgi:biotin operon repressor
VQHKSAKGHRRQDLARKKKIPSVDYAMKLVAERIRDDVGGKIGKLAGTIGELEKRVDGLEESVDELERLEEGAAGDAFLPLKPRKRVSPDEARRVILELLERAEGGFVSSRELGGPLGIGRATVAARLEELREEGYEIVSSPRKGYALIE